MVLRLEHRLALGADNEALADMNFARACEVRWELQRRWKEDVGADVLCSAFARVFGLQTVFGDCSYFTESGMSRKEHSWIEINRGKYRYLLDLYPLAEVAIRPLLAIAPSPQYKPRPGRNERLKLSQRFKKQVDALAKEIAQIAKDRNLLEAA